MNKVRIVKKGSYKDYLSVGISDGFIVGVLVFIFSLFFKSIISAFLIGLVVWFSIIFIFMTVGFPSEEYFKRKPIIKELYSSKYKFLDNHGFVLDEELFFSGVYRDYHFRVFPMTKYQKKGKDIKYVIIESFYKPEQEFKGIDREQNLSGNYFIGNLLFANNRVGFIPKDFTLPDFQENFNGLIAVLKREDLMPLSINEWLDTYGKILETEVVSDDKPNKLLNFVLKIINKIDKPIINSM